MKYLVVGIICFVIGYLDPVVIWRKLTDYGENSLFPKMTDWRNTWRGKTSLDIEDEVKESEK